MLDPWIIEEIRRREEEERHHQEQRPQIELPLERPVYPGHGKPAGEDKQERGVVILDF